MTRKDRTAGSCSCGCGCDQPASTTDDIGMPVCADCAAFVVVEDGDVVCKRQWDKCLGGKYEHQLVEHDIETHGPGQPNTQYRFCGRCGAGWYSEEHGSGNWVVVRFESGKDDDEDEEDEDEFGACQGGEGQG